ncbi:two-component system, chemotaxis family, response regulator CheB [Rhodoblastus acidophilus]|uniref:Protein-glutamate methylesterase/protein-glutamine glutaminase n=1 Tax=Rhodoblastus acidophilus TaxID=1074 RepID=A0A212S0W2_RHOAC|nr:chemotaxis-specific protein-glutamate methyltransferase CheB [Rhodoblastus acidophilus]PPQ38213.1 chemotaxis-specific protein-glutamate methyltransferase CheB [Rhodoblastus acidophilus]RAI16870.1 chemotaxis response regulator protein-glutamate methylesterase [Rhodoblastus acidophilus]SNB78777.1 two-component system, chemotaxis family, response regulator CheB [Rhodoblastus acidophilus]
MIRVLIVDDSALMRRHLTSLLSQERGFETATARNGVEALDMIERESFDVVTLDVNMPEMDGLTCLSRIMAHKPMPVVMVSSITAEGAEATFEALALGAVDFVRKPSGTISLTISQIEETLIAKVKAAAKAKLRRSVNLRQRLTEQRRRAQEAPPPIPRSLGPFGMVLIGVSTGGPTTLEHILPYLPRNLPWPVVVAQHMPGNFTGVFARRLNGACELEVIEVCQQTPVEAGRIYIARGDGDLVFTRRGGKLLAMPMPAGADYLWHPSVARMVESALSQLPAQQLIGVLLTGMGNDGAEAMAKLRERGGHTIAQDEETSVVFGMPADLIARKGAEVVLSDEDVAEQLCIWLRVHGAFKQGGRNAG